MSTVTSILSSDIVSDSRTTINNNFANLNTIAGIHACSITYCTGAASETKYSDVGGTYSATETAGGTMVSGSHTVKNLVIGVKANTLNTNSAVFTLYKNGSATGITCSVLHGVTTFASDTTHSFTVVAGDRLSVQHVTSAGSGSINFGFSYELN
jgi:hypothetical protein